MNQAKGRACANLIRWRQSRLAAAAQDLQQTQLQAAHLEQQVAELAKRQIELTDTILCQLQTSQINLRSLRQLEEASQSVADEQLRLAQRQAELVAVGEQQLGKLVVERQELKKLEKLEVRRATAGGNATRGGSST